MNTKLALTAITLVAVIMGLSAFAPAVMASPNNEHNPKENVCHFDTDTNDDGDLTTDDRAWIVKPVNKHAKLAHTGHGDLTVPGQISAEDCVLQADPTP